MYLPMAQLSALSFLVFFLTRTDAKSVPRPDREAGERMIREGAALHELKALVRECNSERMVHALRHPNLFSAEFQTLRKCLALLQILRPEPQLPDADYDAAEASTRRTPTATAAALSKQKRKAGRWESLSTELELFA